MRKRSRSRCARSRRRTPVNSLYLAEALEPRTLFNIVVNGTDGNDTLTVDCNGSFVFVTLNGIPGIPIPIIGDAGELQINGLGGNDAIDVTETGGLPCLISGGNGNDTITVGGGNFSHFLGGGGTSVEGDAGTDTTIIDDTADTGADTYSVSGSLDGSLTVFTKSDSNAFGMSVDNTTENVQLRCNNDSDTINVNNNTTPPFASFAVQGGGGNDTLNLQQVGGARAFSFDGGSGTNSLSVQDPGFGGNTFTLTSNQLDYVFFGTADHISWSNTQQVKIDDSSQSQNATFNVDGVGSGIATTVNGGSGKDTFIVGNGNIAANILGPLSINTSGDEGHGDKVIYDDTGATANSNYTVQFGTNSLSMTGLVNPVTAMADSYVLSASSGDNIITAIPVNGQTDWTINGDLGNDQITFGSGNITGLFGNATLTGGGGTDTLTINDGGAHSNITSEDYTISQGVVHLFVNGLADYDLHYSSFDAVTLSAGILNNHFTVGTALGGENSLTLNAGGGNDSLSIAPFATTGLITFNGQGGTDQVSIDDSGDTNLIARTYTLTSSSFTKFGVDSVNFSGIEALSVQGDNAADTYNVNSTAAGSTTTVSGGTSPDVFNVGNGSLNANIAGNVTLEGNQGGDHLVVNDTADTGSDTITLNNGTITKSTMTAAVTYGTIEHVEFDGDAGNNLFNLISPGFATDVTLKGGAAKDAFNITPSTASVEVDGSDPTVAPGDVLRFNNAASAGSAALTVNGAVNGTYTFAAAQPVTFFGIETFPTVPAAPPTPDLLAADDTGLLNSDNITSKLSVTINGTAPASSLVQLRVGNTVLGSGTANASGAYSIPATFGGEGTFAIGAVLEDPTSGLLSAPSPALNITVDRTAPPAPSVAPDLTALSDTGVSNTDNITRINTPTITGTVPVGTLARLIVDGSPAAILSGSGGIYSITAPSLADGVRQLAVRFEDLAGNFSTTGPALAVTIDTRAPTITSAVFDDSTTHALNFNFSEDVGPTVDQTDLSLQNVTNATTILPGSIAKAYLNNTATFTFPGLNRGLLPEGRYHAVLSAAGITDVAGNVLASDGVLDFSVLTADVNGDGSVSFNDLLTLAQHFGQPGNFAAGDVNYDGTVNFNDLLLLAQNFGRSLPPPAAAAFDPLAGTDRIRLSPITGPRKLKR